MSIGILTDVKHAEAMRLQSGLVGDLGQVTSVNFMWVVPVLQNSVKIEG